MSIDPSAAAWREPDHRHAGDAALAPVAMAAQDQIDNMVVFQLLEDVGRMGQ